MIVSKRLQRGGIALAILLNIIAILVLVRYYRGTGTPQTHVEPTAVVSPVIPSVKPAENSKPADAHLPPMEEGNLQTLIESYSADELRMLATVQKETKKTPPIELQTVIRMVRAGDDAKAVDEFIREKVPGIPAKVAAREWALRKLGSPDLAPMRPPHEGGGAAPMVKGIEGGSGPRDSTAPLVNPSP